MMRLRMNGREHMRECNIRHPCYRLAAGLEEQGTPMVWRLRIAGPAIARGVARACLDAAPPLARRWSLADYRNAFISGNFPDEIAPAGRPVRRRPMRRRQRT